MTLRMMTLSAALLGSTLLGSVAMAGGVITHGRDNDHILRSEECDQVCMDLADWAAQVFESRDAFISRRADELGQDEVTLEMLDAPEQFGVEPEPGEGCAASGASLGTVALALMLLRRRRRKFA
ncbi:MAG: hypothetical protein AAFQ82_20405 [Myxococcota bacterium]